ncbi:carboxypeptidase-like regulatory domain-containing protein [Granulicella sp. 5B5]|uniref:TonB-dependent receptor n=1 Tax=Granulicella sp. 5B5 TaxID=1617967 RepID=UPI002105AB8E|nr:carboxypeptidase-like regulatory domain-containing protein [Granulicella sp. 5B5]
MRFLAAASVLALAMPYAFAAAPAEIPAEATPATCHGDALNGTVRDTTQALIPGAMLSMDGAAPITSGSDGRYHFSCVTRGEHKLVVTMPGFTAKVLAVKVPHGALDVVLAPAEVQSEVSVDAGEGAAVDSSAAGPTQTIAGDRLQSLADDPDDLQQQLQQLAAAAGGNPSNTTISVDGFQDSSKLPPKSSIAYIKVNPDQFSAEYREPPFDGGRVEIYTKPGQPTYHGALFMTNGSPWENARDPFSTSKAALGKQRYGFELTGPITKKGSDFSLTLEHRAINNFAVVNATTLDSNFNPVSTIQNVPTTQALWVGEARVDWQLGPKNTFIASYSPNVNHLLNVGVGGTSLASTGYDNAEYDHLLHLSDITTINAKAMHEARVSLRWDGSTETPVTNTPQVQVAGAFSGGGSTFGPQTVREFKLEVDDDAILTPKNHTIKFGVQELMAHDTQQLTTNFNGVYTFGGGSAPVLDASGNPTGATETITGLQQYQRALQGQAGGAPTAYSVVTGTPKVSFTQFQNAVFIQDDWNVGRGVHIASGARYYWQNDPTVLSSFTPRAGVLWSPDKKGRWTLHAHAGLFAGRYGTSDIAEVLREDGTKRVTSTVYNAVFCNGAATCNPEAGGTPIYSLRQFDPHISNLTWGAENVGGTRALPAGFNLSADWYVGRIWNYSRTENINSPLNGEPTGPRPGPANTNILQMNNSGQGRVNATFVGVENHTLKRFQFFFGGVRVNLIDDTDDNELSTPQTTGVETGEYAHRTGQPEWNIFGNASLKLPEKVQLSADFHGGGDAHYNVTTGFDNNGDGNFNDRPQYALPGQAGAVQTPYGLLVASGGTGVLPRNVGVMPWTYYLNLNVQRTFALTRNAKADHPQSLTLNVRSANALNHLNVTSVGGVLGSPTFGVPYAADNGRRIEMGARYSF